jgi:hypothetical protein
MRRYQRVIGYFCAVMVVSKAKLVPGGRNVHLPWKTPHVQRCRGF